MWFATYLPTRMFKGFLWISFYTLLSHADVTYAAYSLSVIPLRQCQPVYSWSQIHPVHMHAYPSPYSSSNQTHTQAVPHHAWQTHSHRQSLALTIHHHSPHYVSLLVYELYMLTLVSQKTSRPSPRHLVPEPDGRSVSSVCPHLGATFLSLPSKITHTAASFSSKGATNAYI